MMHDWYGRHGGMGGMAGGAEWWQWLLVVGAIIVLLVVAAAVVVVMVVLRDMGVGRRQASHDPPRAPAALHGDELILAEQLARGEIDEAEFLARRHALRPVPDVG
jgi:putative membrane protein